MKKIYNLLIVASVALGAVSCQDKDYDIAAPIIAPISPAAITGALQGDNYVWSWNGTDGKSMLVNVYSNGTLAMSETVAGNSFTHTNVETNVPYTYVFKLTDGTNQSVGVVKDYTRPGASKMSGLSMAQLEKAGGYDARVNWDVNETAASVEFTATHGG